MVATNNVFADRHWNLIVVRAFDCLWQGVTLATLVLTDLHGAEDTLDFDSFRQVGIVLPACAEADDKVCSA